MTETNEKLETKINNIDINQNVQTNTKNEEKIQSKDDLNNNINNNEAETVLEISYQKTELVKLMAGSNSLAKNNKEKIKPDQYNLEDPDLFDGKIKCVRLKCICYGIITFFLNSIRLIYLIFLHLGYPAIIWMVRFCCASFCFFCILCQKKEIVIESESQRERIDYPQSNCEKACLLCKNCGIAFYKFIVNFFTCPCWFFSFVSDCFYDIKNRALDNARTGCYKFIHYDCGCYEKTIEDPFNNYMKKRHIILATDPDDNSVIYGDACKDNTFI